MVWAGLSLVACPDHSNIEWTIEMNLIQIREKFRDLSGRYDLVDDDATGTADFLINSGSKFLDRLAEVQKTTATYYKLLDPHGWNVHAGTRPVPPVGLGRRQPGSGPRRPSW